MKIKGYKKLKNNCYQISFLEEEKDLVLYDELILKYDLLLKKEISKSDVPKLIQENNSWACYYKALEYVTGRSRCVKELTEYLQKCHYKEAEIEHTIKMLKERNIFDEEKYLESFIYAQAHFTKYGPKKIKQNLLALAFPEEKVEEEILKIPEYFWQNKLKHFMVKKVNTNHKEGQNRLKERILFTFSKEGYEKEDILSLLDTIEFPKTFSILQKEAKKLYEKLVKKYQGNLLWYQIKGRLVAKGFLFDEIEEAIDELKKNITEL